MWVKFVLWHSALAIFSIMRWAWCFLWLLPFSDDTCSSGMLLHCCFMASTSKAWPSIKYHIKILIKKHCWLILWVSHSCGGEIKSIMQKTILKNRSCWRKFITLIRLPVICTFGKMTVLLLCRKWPLRLAHGCSFSFTLTAVIMSGATSSPSLLTASPMSPFLGAWIYSF